MQPEKLYVFSFDELQTLVAWAVGLQPQSTDIVRLTASAVNAMKGIKDDDTTDPYKDASPYQELG